MSRNQRFSFMSMARPFTPTMANPSGAIHYEARLQLIYCYPLPPFSGIALPLSIVLSNNNAYEIALSNNNQLDISLSNV
jgi:hypothetical protein